MNKTRRRTWQDHTPGPWKWDDHGDLRGKDRNCVINPTLRPDTLSGINREADARLITAAPDLLEALEGLITYHFGDVPQHDYEHATVHQARAALAKAKDES